MLFGHPELLHLLWILPALLIFAIVAGFGRNRRVRQWGDEVLFQRLAPERSSLMRWFRFLAGLLALGFAIVTAARPQVGAQLVQVDRRGVDVVVALDVSLSMEATDVVPSRLARCQTTIRELFDGLRGDRMGVVLFSGTSFLLCPLTLDVVAANLFLDAVDVDVLPSPGTNLEAALQGALDAFGDDENDLGNRGRVIVLFTDGEGHEGNPDPVVQDIKARGIPILVVGVGTPNGEPIPLVNSIGQTTGYKKDRAGEVVLSRLDESTLKSIAEETGGRYYAATLQGSEVDKILDFLEKLEKGELGEAFRRRVEERFQIPAGIALVLLIVAIWTPEGRRRRTAV